MVYPWALLALPALTITAPESPLISAQSPALAANKQRVFSAARLAGATWEEIMLILAVGMGESTNLDISQRDASKDAQGLAANYTAFNLNGDMLTQLYGGDRSSGSNPALASAASTTLPSGLGGTLNSLTRGVASGNLPTVTLNLAVYNGTDSYELGVKAIVDAIRKFGRDKFLCFHRGGAAALADECAYGAQEYRIRMLAVVDYLEGHPEHLTDGIRIFYNIPHV